MTGQLQAVWPPDPMIVETDPRRQGILILDFGSQYTQLIARRVRECGVYSIVKPNTITLKEINLINPRGIVLTGGPESVKSKRKLSIDNKIFNLSTTICISYYFSNKNIRSSIRKTFDIFRQL